MMHPAVKNLFGDNLGFTIEEEELINSCFKPVTAGRNEILLKHGAVAQQMYLVAKGCLRVFLTDGSGNESTRFLIPIEFIKVWERPQDISFALTQLLNDKSFNTVIDPHKIGAASFSFGGYTVIALAGGVVDYSVIIQYYRTIGHLEMEFPEFPGLGCLLYDSTLLAATRHVPDLKDSRIKAFFALSPGTGPGFASKKQFKNVHGAIFITGSLADSMAPVKTNARVYHQLIRGSGYYEFGGHTALCDAGRGK